MRIICDLEDVVMGAWLVLSGPEKKTWLVSDEGIVDTVQK